MASSALDLRVPMLLAAEAIPPRLDPKMDYRPWFLLRGSNGVPTTPEHSNWDLGDMTGRYLEALILARHMGVSAPELSQAEGRLQHYLFKLLRPDGLVHDPQSGAVDSSFAQGSAMYGLLALFEDSGDPAVREALERLISAQLKRAHRQGDLLIDPSVKLEQSSGSHLAGYQIYPAIRFYELTGYGDALTLAAGLSRWALSDPVLGPDGAITKPLSWEGHIHSWLDTLAGCARTARVTTEFDRPKTLARCRAVYDWVRRSNATSFGWVATYPTGRSCETCAISSSVRLALELAASGFPEYLDDVERFVRNQLVQAQFKDLDACAAGGHQPTPLLLGCFDSQSLPNGHFGSRGGEDVGTVEGCCLSGGMRALALAWNAIQSSDETGMQVNLGLSRNGPAGQVIGYQPAEGRVDVLPRVTGVVRIRLPRWVAHSRASVLLNGEPVSWAMDQDFAVLSQVPAGARVSLRYPLRELGEEVSAGGQQFRVHWKGDVVMSVAPSAERASGHERGDSIAAESAQAAATPELPDRLPVVPDTYSLQDAARLANLSMLARLDLQRGGEPFFRIYPFATPPYAQHEKWDDGDMTGRYVEGLLLSRRLTGQRMDSREGLLRSYLLGLFDFADGLCYTRQAPWTPRRACVFSQSSAMLGLLAWYRETGSREARKLLDWQADGLMHLAVSRSNYVYFPKYEFDGAHFINDPANQDAPPWYGGRLILPLVEYWQLSGRDDIKVFLEKLVRYSTQVSSFVKPDGAVESGEGWWGHLHGTMDMAAGIAEFGRLTKRPELVAWAGRVYDWVGRTQTTRYGWIADVSGGKVCESCAIASRIRLGLALYRAGAADPFGDIDRCLRNQLLENQFVDLGFLSPLKPETPRTEQKAYRGIDRMIRGTFQCWGTANDLLGHDDIEGCGAAGGVQGIALALNSQYEWRDTPHGQQLRLHLLFNRALRAKPQAPFTLAAPVAAELFSYLPYEGRVEVRALQPIAQLALRLPDGTELAGARVRRGTTGKAGAAVQLEGQYALIPNVAAGEKLELVFPLREYQSRERAAGVEYRVSWKGSSVVKLTPPGTRAPLYASRGRLHKANAPLCTPRYP